MWPHGILTSVALVFSTPLLSSLPREIAASIESFADPSGLWTLESASDAGLVRLLDRLVAQVPPDEDREAQYSRGVRRATEAGDLAVLHWWLFSYSGHPKIPDYQFIFRRAASFGHLEILQWLKHQEALPVSMWLRVREPLAL